MDVATDTVARTLWGEARNQGLDGMAAVANVIANRVASPGWWGSGWAGVCRKRYQFSCWLDDDPNLPRLLSVTEKDGVFRDAVMLAKAVIAGELRDRTKGATHYHADSIPAPKWAKGEKPTVVIGAHRFFRL